MDNLNSPEQSDLSWLTTWSTFPNQPRLLHGHKPRGSLFLQQLIEASLQGDSCIEISPEQTGKHLANVISAEQAKSQVAPCVHDEQVGIIPILEPRATSS